MHVWPHDARRLAPQLKAVRRSKKRVNIMKYGFCVLVALCVFSLLAGCRSGVIATTLPIHPQVTVTLEPAAMSNQMIVGSTPTCPPARGEGTVSPAISIDSIVFVVNGIEQVVREGDLLQALPGEEVQVDEVTICVGSFSGDGGEACVDLAPVTPSGQEIVSEHIGTHTVKVAPGFMSISGPDQNWIIGENWEHVSVVLNHWPPDNTEDRGCGGGRCEHDDRIIVRFR